MPQYVQQVASKVVARSLIFGQTLMTGQLALRALRYYVESELVVLYEVRSHSTPGLDSKSHACPVAM